MGTCDGHPASRVRTVLAEGVRYRTTEKYESLYRDRSGKRHRRSFIFKKQARRWLDEQTAAMVTGEWADPRAGEETAETYGERWLARQVMAASR